MSNTQLPALLTTEETAAYLRVSQRSVWNWCKDGHLPAFQIGRRWRIRKERLDELIDELEAEGGDLVAAGEG